jgi:hypothetical protein
VTRNSQWIAQFVFPEKAETQYFSNLVKASQQQVYSIAAQI